MALHTHLNPEPCLVAPSPNLQARFRAQKNDPTHPKLAAFMSQVFLRHDSSLISAPTGAKLGLNDGVIFPKEHFTKAPSRSTLLNAAANREPLRGAIKVAVVLVDFDDKHMATGAKKRFEDLLFGKISTGSATQYYSDVSAGKISLTGEVVGPYRMPKKLVEYTAGNNGFNDAEPNLQTLAADALTACKAEFDFKSYDNDGNGYVDAFVMVHAGAGAEESGSKDDIWSAKWTLPQEAKLNGVSIFGFLTIPEDAEVGVCVHELGHLLFGWPDLYDTDYSSEGIGSWCVMSAGSWGGTPAGTTPCHPSAWCKATQKWVDVVSDTKSQDVTLLDVKKAHKIHKVWKVQDTTSQEYFLYENRQQTGFDKSLPGPGLLVWHVDDAKDSNADENHPKVALMQADGLGELKANKNRGDAGDAFPGSAHKTELGPTTTPDTKSYAGEDTKIAFTNISPSQPEMTLHLSLGATASG